MEILSVTSYYELQALAVALYRTVWEIRRRLGYIENGLCFALRLFNAPQGVNSLTTMWMITDGCKTMFAGLLSVADNMDLTSFDPTLLTLKCPRR